MATAAADPVSRQTLSDKQKTVNALNVIFQVTDRCVLRCRYCFARGAHKKIGGLMKPALLDAAIEQSFDTAHAAITFEWTGGEAFLAGKRFYADAVKAQKRHAAKPYTNTVQTSGYLFDKELIDFLVDNGFRISLTIDGPPDVHNGNRPSQKGTPSYDDVLRTRDYIAAKQGSCGAIVTITKQTLGREGEILGLFRRLGMMRFHSNPYIYCGAHTAHDETLALSNSDYATYFINQFHAWLEQGRPEPVPGTLDYIVKSAAAGSGLPDALCTFGGRCLTHFAAIVPNGDVYPCPKFTGSSHMRLGNLCQTPLKAILSETSAPMERLLDERASAIHKCRSQGCQHLSTCNSGCPYYSFVASGGKDIAHRDRLCSGKAMLFDYLGAVMDSLAAGQGDRPIA